MPNGYPTEQALEKARSLISQTGRSAKEWAEDNSLSPSTVYAVLNGQKKCLRGEAHRAAVLLGIKEGVIGEVQRYGRRKTDAEPAIAS
ncbi:DNA-binding protein [Pseudomonas kuykendallii]|uniref:Phage-associated protein, BcepMu gp16 family n=1 Tax=Pseudomonas kuykendallii TaxID=1007099 RepID=A0A1H3DNJ7_9PSED|nr:DNA-binding protein [Pseudomonas kuykendallii]MCQ4270236.1 DNA-binding protein [Pseudomonas kuykendallii]SDX67234.1 phage-associated protein, BcepMu gp16 family [Pseudomonas kuykendallii]